jgi:hypothetical protein
MSQDRLHRIRRGFADETPPKEAGRRTSGRYGPSLSTKNSPTRPGG